ncbi:F-box/LRR-repeat protein 3 [Holothuria leucospilota]|uniref:F-box/LRR-repeat protein 3 n=1 Tax=Holothuria leucospilota TaxID=206669 RepID=A0A9Q1BLC7_HOLLE|nr:F-box/LRR-repeat protein 3 [Holothuria leucospilota]
MESVKGKTTYAKGKGSLSFNQRKGKDKQTGASKSQILSKYLKDPVTHPTGWEKLPSNVLVRVYSFLNFWDRARASTVCCHWNSVFHLPELWRRFDFEVTQETTSYMKSTPRGLVRQVLHQHKDHLRFVSISIDGHPLSAEIACDILSQLMNCSIKTLELMSTAKPTLMMKKEKFVAALNVVIVNSQSISSLALSDTPVDDPSLEVLAKQHHNSLTLLNMESCPNASAIGITFVADQCRRLHQLTIDYSQLSDELLSSLCSEEHVTLKYLRINVIKQEGQTETNFPTISQDSWDTLARHSPDLSLVMYFYVVNDEDYAHFFNYITPVTHVYFGRSVSREVLGRLASHCPGLKELAICANGHEPLDMELLDIANRCKGLNSLGLGECEVHCSAMVQLAKICGERLSELFIREEVLVEDGEFSIDEMTERVSETLGRQWYPESMPYWD